FIASFTDSFHRFPPFPSVTTSISDNYPDFRFNLSVTTSISDNFQRGTPSFVRHNLYLGQFPTKTSSFVRHTLYLGHLSRVFAQLCPSASVKISLNQILKPLCMERAFFIFTLIRMCTKVIALCL